MFILILCCDGEGIVVKKSSISRVYKVKGAEESYVVFHGKGNTPLRVPLTPKDFYHKYLS